MIGPYYDWTKYSMMLMEGRNKYRNCMPSEKIKKYSELIDNKPFIDQPTKCNLKT